MSEGSSHLREKIMAHPALHNTQAYEPRSIEPDSLFGRAISGAAVAAARALSELACAQVSVNRTQIEVLPLRDLPFVGGSPGDDVVALFLTFGGGDDGDIMLVYDIDQARSLADQMLMAPRGTTIEFDELALSAIAESGNIIGSHFLTAIASLTGTELEISTPTPLIDTRGAVLSIPATRVANSGDTFLAIQSEYFCQDGPEIGATLLVLPHNGFHSAILRGLV
jgi:chemotaxis protein CheC